MIPVYKDLKDALSKYKEVDTIVNFASSRSAYQATLDMLDFSQIKHITIIAEGVPERHTRHLIRKSKETKTIILGPSTVGGIKPGAFRIGNTGGMLDNIVSSKLHRPGSVGFVSKSGGLSNELANIISRCTNGVIEGMAIGGDRHPVTTFMDNVIRYQRDPRCKILVVLGEVGGVLEYEVAEAVKKGIITKPVIAWYNECIY
ncbi:ATP-citrate synthase subunit 1 [Reticulomyxa filosa]|uniref:ATP citrate synthase n=1 Tax=Reticulomyxa filosa TaxID=46433 RepID=X6P0Y3_RETFI|nr:ATP-citrate synthase subunit 1 [Reticulomyxa filosa]|eukprot:ETO32230.1 ATP-citrate synthase subunit 1 [Reticulomyxa filosa]